MNAPIEAAEILRAADSDFSYTDDQLVAAMEVAAWALPLLDQTPIDGKWLESVGFKRDDEDPFFWINDRGPPRAFGFDLRVWDYGRIDVADPDGNVVVKYGTLGRGELRLLCRALGITLHERAE